MGLITRPAKSTGGTTYSDGTIPNAADFNGDFVVIHNEFNGNIDNANIKSAAAIAGSKISPVFASALSVPNNAGLNGRNQANDADITIGVVDDTDVIVLSPNGNDLVINSVCEITGVLWASGGITDDNNVVVMRSNTGTPVFQFNMFATGAENGFTFLAKGPGTRPALNVNSPDANMGLDIIPKGTSSVIIGDVLTINSFEFTPGSTPTLSVIGPSSNVSLILAPKGTGVVNISTKLHIQGVILSGVVRIANTTWNAPSIPHGSSASTSVTVTGAVPGDFALVSSEDTTLGITGGISLTARVSTNNSVMITWINNSGAAIDPPSTTYHIKVLSRL